MSLVNNIDKVAFASPYSIDKIVRVWEGTFSIPGSTELREDEFIGSIRVHKIAHGFSRPVFVDLIWSLNGSTWADGGGTISGNSSIAFSDSTHIYIVAAASSGTQHYKVVASWIDTYDGSNPLVDSYSAPQKSVLFDSRDNYQKINKEGTTTYPSGTFGSAHTVTVSHSLGYIPNAKAYFEPIAGEVWPLNAGGIQNPFLYDGNQDEAFMRIYNNRLEIEVLRFSGATRRVWYKIYYDQD